MFKVKKTNISETDFPTLNVDVSNREYGVNKRKNPLVGKVNFSSKIKQNLEKETVTMFQLFL